MSARRGSSTLIASVPSTVAGGQGHLGALGEEHAVLGEGAGADLGTGEVDEDADVAAGLGAAASARLVAATVLVERAVGQAEPHHVHARRREGAEHLGGPTPARWWRGSSCGSMEATLSAVGFKRAQSSVPSSGPRTRPISPALSAAGHLDPGQVLVDPDVAGQAEDALAEDVPHDLGGAALDRVGPRPQERLLRAASTGRSSAAGPSRSRSGRACPRRPRRSTAKLVDVLVQLGHGQLADRALGPGRARACGSGWPGCW